MHNEGVVCGIDGHSVKIVILSGIQDGQTNMSVSEKGSHAIKIGAQTRQKIHLALFSPMFASYIGLVIAAHTRQKGLI